MGNKIDIPGEILDNAIAAIELGVEDYKLSEKDPRRIQSAVRNIFAGILLLFKSKLAELSRDNDESLLKQKVLPIQKDGKIEWVGEGKKTVDVQQIKERFLSLNISVDWKRLNNLQDYRNNIEHYYDRNSCNLKAVGSYIASSFLIICDFVGTYLKKDPKKIFDDKVWRVFIIENDVFEKELETKINSFKSLLWFSEIVCDICTSFHCSVCGSEIIVAHAFSSKNQEARKAEFECRACSKRYSYETMIKELTSSMFQGNILVKDDIAYDFIDICPECGEQTYDTMMEICYLCGASNEYTCGRCGDPVPKEEISSYEETGMCGYCTHMEEQIMEDD